MTTAAAEHQELSRSDPSRPGIRRLRSGRGFRYVGPGGRPVKDPRVLARIKALVIPPVWEDVWICPHAVGHIQAMGTDSAGPRQYRYHDMWREQRDQDKHDRMLEFGRALPGIRDAVRSHLDGRGLSRDRVLAAAITSLTSGSSAPAATSTRRRTARSAWPRSAGST